MTLRNLFLLLAALTVFARSGHAGEAALPKEGPVELSVMSFNIWYGGEQVSFPTVIEAIKRANPDIIGLQEPDGNLARVAAAAGYAYIDQRRNIISRYPIFDSGVGVRLEAGPAPYGIAALDRANVHAWVMVPNGRVVAVANTHLTSDPYGPEAVREGKPMADALAIENSVRVPEAEPLVVLGALARSGVPVFLTGDFNSPSHLDWTAAMQKVRPAVIRYPVLWPVTKMLADAGLRDSYRESHPDPTLKPGLTWTAGMPHPHVRPNETLDRIDYIFTAGRSQTLSSRILGEVGGPDVDISISPYPSDHRGVVSTFRVEPVAAPSLIAVEPRQVTRGQDILVRGFVKGSEKWTAHLVPLGKGVAHAVGATIDEIAGWRQAARFSTSDFKPGAYEAILMNTEGREEARTRFFVLGGATPTLKAAASVKAGQPVKVTWTDAPGNRHDWIGIFRAGDPNISDYLGFRYTDAAWSGSADIPTLSDGKPLPPGSYEARLLRDDSLTIMARAPFRITAR
jgi:endonuclease/exonuclease/phosphatase family metal-dependent hydrolase